MPDGCGVAPGKSEVFKPIGFNHLEYQRYGRAVAGQCLSDGLGLSHRIGPLAVRILEKIAVGNAILRGL